jgi:hypothetical protein
MTESRPSHAGLITSGQPEPVGLRVAGSTGQQEEAMSDFVKVFETTGAVSISVDDDFVCIRQDGVLGDDAGQVAIPRPLFKDVLSTIFAALAPYELQDISELAKAHAKPTPRGEG